MKHIPQINETPESNEERMAWFRHAKYGMFIHWGPCSVGEKEIGWGRGGNRPWDIDQHGPRTSDPVYDNYYKSFNPEKFDADQWVRFAKKSGMKYMVLITKHHDGFSMFDTTLSDYSIMASPFGRDIVKEFIDACHTHEMKVGLYYSTRDWYHPDYLVNDNTSYDQWYMGQVEELLTSYGPIDLMWFDHVGGRDWGKWKFDQLFSKMYQHQPHLLVNDRAAKFCGPKTDSDKEPATPDLKKMAAGDYYTPEGKIGAMDIERDWESCIHVGKGWSYRGEDGFKDPEACIKMLVSCTTGGGNLLLNFGPRPDGTFAEGEVRVAEATGQWLEKYGAAIYGTRGGPYSNGLWGGSCFRDNKLYLHVYNWQDNEISLDPLPVKVLSCQTLEGKPVELVQNDTELTIRVSPSHQDHPVTIVECTLDGNLKPGILLGALRMEEGQQAEYGEVLAEESDSNVSEIRTKRLKTIKAVQITMQKEHFPADGLVLHVHDHPTGAHKTWETKTWQEEWMIPVTHFHAGIDVLGRQSRRITLSTGQNKETPIHLSSIKVFGS